LLAKDQGDLWDSGQVKSDESSQVAYAGAALKSREACFWKVRATDSSGQTTAWSEPARWEMGFLKPGDWQAKWIDAPMVAKPGAQPKTMSILKASYEAVDGAGAKDVTDIVTKMLRNNSLTTPVNSAVFGGDPARLHVKQLRVSYIVNGEKQEVVAAEGTILNLAESNEALPYLRKDFSVDKSISKVRVYATALGLYELRLNGRRVGDHVFAPDWTDYNKRARYQVYDVTSLVKPGVNTLAALVGNGWYSGHIGNGGFQAWGKVPALFAQLEVTCTDGSVDRIVTDASWKMHAGPILSSDIMLG
jgi:alpha-L-rhamnosidase